MIRLRCEKCDRRIDLDEADVDVRPAPYGMAGVYAYAGAHPVSCPYHIGSTYWLRPVVRGQP